MLMWWLVHDRTTKHGSHKQASLPTWSTLFDIETIRLCCHQNTTRTQLQKSTHKNDYARTDHCLLSSRNGHRSRASSANYSLFFYSASFLFLFRWRRFASLKLPVLAVRVGFWRWRALNSGAPAERRGLRSHSTQKVSHFWLIKYWDSTWKILANGQSRRVNR